jgi:MerR family redox-sensitive transcriptional activator SoxR
MFRAQFDSNTIEARGSRFRSADVANTARTSVRTLAVIETAQRAGLNLDEIRLLLDAPGDDTAATERLRDVAERKLPELETLIERAELVRQWLEDAASRTCPMLDGCPFFYEPGRLPQRTRSVN